MKIIFLGIQGSGKSTQAKILAEKLSLPYIETGQLLREEKKKNSKDSQKIAKALDYGNLVSDEITMRILKARLAKSDCQNGYILDGYPRNEIQFDNLDSGIDKVFYVNVSDKEAVKRLLLRKRHDDTGEALKRRIELYHQKAELVFNRFKEKGVFEEVDGERTVDEIAKDIGSRVTNYAKKNIN